MPADDLATLMQLRAADVELRLPVLTGWAVLLR